VDFDLELQGGSATCSMEMGRYLLQGNHRLFSKPPGSDKRLQGSGFV